MDAVVPPRSWLSSMRSFILHSSVRSHSPDMQREKTAARKEGTEVGTEPWQRGKLEGVRMDEMGYVGARAGNGN